MSAEMRRKLEELYAWHYVGRAAHVLGSGGTKIEVIAATSHPTSAMLSSLSHDFVEIHMVAIAPAPITVRAAHLRTLVPCQFIAASFC
jgi:hypothetical protein